MRPVIKARVSHCASEREERVSCQYQRKRATAKEECAWDHEGLKYMYTGSELAHQMASVARSAQRSSTYWRVRRKARNKPRDAERAVEGAMLIQDGAEKDSSAA